MRAECCRRTTPAATGPPMPRRTLAAADILDRDLGPQHEHAQALADGGDQCRRQHQFERACRRCATRRNSRACGLWRSTTPRIAMPRAPAWRRRWSADLEGRSLHPDRRRATRASSARSQTTAWSRAAWSSAAASPNETRRFARRARRRARPGIRSSGSWGVGSVVGRHAGGGRRPGCQGENCAKIER